MVLLNHGSIASGNGAAPSRYYPVFFETLNIWATTIGSGRRSNRRVPLRVGRSSRLWIPGSRGFRARPEADDSVVSVPDELHPAWSHSPWIPLAEKNLDERPCVRFHRIPRPRSSALL